MARNLRAPTALLAVTLLHASTERAARADDDAFLRSGPRPEGSKATPGGSAPAASDRGEERLTVSVRSREPRLGVPTMLWVANRPRPPTWAVTPAGAALHFLERLAPRYRLDAADLERVRVRAVHDRGEGLTIVTLAGTVDGIPAFRDELDVALDRDLRLIAMTGYLSPHLGDARGTRDRFELDPERATAAALEAHLGVPIDALGHSDRAGGWTRFASGPVSPGARLGQPTRARPVLYNLPDRLEPAYHVEITVESSGGTDMMGYVVSARDGRVLSERNLVAEHPFTYRVFVDTHGRPLDGPNGNDEIPDRSATPVLPPRDWSTPEQVTLPHAAISTGDPWMTQSSSVTSGNNVDAYADLNAPDGLTSGDFRATTSAPDTFDWTFDPESDADANAEQQRSSIVHAFYVTNWLHDEFYDVGFDEAAGNAQRDNYGRGGIEGDDMRVEVQDYSGRNNANMATPSDGGRPRMQMYLWSGAARVNARVLAPASLATDYATDDATFGPRDFDVEADLAAAVDAGGTTLLDACDPPVGSAVSGKIALIERGNCTFASKVLNVQNAGAVGAIIYNNRAGNPPGMGGSEPAVSIGVVSLTRDDGAALDAQLGGGSVRIRISRDAGVTTDSAVDSMVVAHEWGHYVSNRLIGNGFGLSGNQARGMGEGWSDFHGMMLTVRADDANVATNAGFDGAYAGATSYVSPRGSYFGIRRVPYSTDPTINGLTFRHIQDDEPLPDVPTAFGQNGSRNTFVHQTGEVWATMLWEAWSALIDSPRLSFDEAYDRMKAYIIEGYKLTPVNPTFVEARDAILLAAFGRDPADFEIMYEAFARRGTGIGAEAPDRFSRDQVPVVESFETGAFVEYGPSELADDRSWCDREGVLDGGETGSLYVDLSNLGSEAFLNPRFELRSLTAGLSFPGGNTTSLAALSPFEGTTATVAVALDSTFTEPALAEIALDVTDPALAFGPTQTATIGFRVHADEVTTSSRTDDVEAEATVWARNASSSFADGFERVEGSPVQHWWFGATESFPAEATLTSPALNVPPGANLEVSFRHRFDIEETWDGGVVEVSTDGTRWEDASVYADPGYPATLRTSSNNPNPLRGRDAFTGKNPSHPGWDAVTLDFGTAFSGSTFYLRFRVGSDWAVAGPGWELDDLAFTGISGTPFAAVVADRGRCVNRPPRADAGPDLVVPERTVVDLDASGSTDPDGDPLTESWARVDGPAVTLTSTTGRFVAPEVATDTLLTFELKVADGEFVSEPDFVSVLVQHVNRAPGAPAVEGPVGATERSAITLTATATDPDGDPIVRYGWQQLEGPRIEVSSQGARLELSIPEVADTATIAVGVRASDGLRFGPMTEHRVRVRSENRLPTSPRVQGKTVTEGSWVSLVARAEDPDGDPLSYTFVPSASRFDIEPQTRGPDRFRFRAPEVDADEIIAIAVRADDGFGPGPSTEVEVEVLDVPDPSPRPDAGVGIDRGSGSGSVTTTDDGCGCTTTARTTKTAPWVGFAFVALGWLAGHRRRPVRPRSRSLPPSSPRR